MVICFIHTVVFRGHHSTATHETVVAAANIATMNCGQEYCCPMLAAGTLHTRKKRRALAFFTSNKIITRKEI